MKKLSLDEIALLEEMKSNCLKEGQYIDEKAKDKFNMLCHLEDFSIAYYELLDVIKEVRECIKETQYDLDTSIVYSEKERLDLEEILRILDKEKK